MKTEAKAMMKHITDCEKEICRLRGKIIAIEARISLLVARRNDYKAVLDRIESEGTK